MIPGLSLAGAEGLEPSACGFGVNMGRALYRKASRSFQWLSEIHQFSCGRRCFFDAILFKFVAKTLPFGVLSE